MHQKKDNSSKKSQLKTFRSYVQLPKSIQKIFWCLHQEVKSKAHELS